MKFLIQRLSDHPYFYENGDAPIEGAFLVRDANEDEFKTQLWGIEINSLDELIALQEKCQTELIFGKVDEYDYPPEEYKYQIKIYDDFNE